MSLAIRQGPPREETQSSSSLFSSTSPSSHPQTATVPPAALSLSLSLSLHDLLHNCLILRHVAPYLPISSLLHLAATDRSLRHLIFHTPGVFRHLDLSKVQSLQPDPRWGLRPDDNITEDEFYSGPLRATFSRLQRLNVLQDVQTLILDGLSVTAELCHDIINNPCFNVRILSIRSVRNLNHGKLVQTLRYACRPSRPKGTPRLEALYLFGPKVQPGVLSPIATPWDTVGDAWWDERGHIVPTRSVSAEWAHCMLACEGIISFDAVLCRGPRHRNSPVFNFDFDSATSDTNSDPSVAVFGLSACDACGDAPEGMIHARHSPPQPDSLHARPLLSPPPLLSSTLRAATMPRSTEATMVARCPDCIRERFCTICVKWWCESCYRLPLPLPLPSLSLDLGAGLNPTGPPTAQQELLSPDNDSDDEGHLDELDSDSNASSPQIKARVSKSCWECGNNCDECIDRTQRVCKKCCAGYCITHNEGSTMTHCDSLAIALTFMEQGVSPAAEASDASYQGLNVFNQPG